MNRRTILGSAAAVLALASLPAMAQEVTTENLEISGAFARASPMMASAGAGFMTIRAPNAGDQLIGFRSDACTQPELHTHIHDNGMMRMRQVEVIDVPAGGEVKLEPGSFHLMFIGLSEQLVEGESITATLIFAEAGEVEITLPVKGPGAME
ncbi:MAG: copper chaperone PCu(A)C [Rhodobacteraceae bacterium]|nr:copper chaperone PCu(A)C [Paracoccaceae bacterium]